MAKVKKVFSWKKWAIKVGKNLVYVIAAGLLASYGNNPYYLAVAPLIVGLENYLKNK